jgi:biotin carboxyl carrier protein
MAKMTFVATVEEEEKEVIVDDHGEDDGRYTLQYEGSTYEMDAQELPSHILHALINDRSYDVDLEWQAPVSDTLDGRVSVRVLGRVSRLDILDERRKKMKDAQSTGFDVEGQQRVNSPMPGKVFRINVKEGDEVKEGQGVVIIEAMKMENELKSPKDGVVTKVAVSEGDTVDSGTLLVAIE